MNPADKIAYLINNSNLQPTTKSFIGSVLKDFGQNFDEEAYEEGAKEHNEGEMDVIAQLQDLLEQLMEMENEEMGGEEMEMEAEEEGEDEGEEDEEEFEFGEEDEGEDEEEFEFGEEDEGEDEEEDAMGGGSVKIMRGMF